MPPFDPAVEPAVSVAPFRWRDGERLVVFGRGAVSQVGELLEPGYALLTTARAGAQTPDLLEHAAAVHEVASGRVDEVAGALRPEVLGDRLVALGGGRVIDVAKALAAADPPRTVTAIPTTLSGAEMTGGHRHAAGVPAGTPGVRPAIVINDPSLSASQPRAQLARSSGNALGHAIEGPVTPLTNPVAAVTAVAAVRLIAAGLAADLDERDRDALALGALLAGYVIGSTGYGLHHVVSQTLARFAGVAHGTANTIMLPQTTRALAARFPDWNARLERALGTEPASLAERVRELAALTGLRGSGVSEEQLEICVEQASQRPDLAMTPPPASVAELRELYRAAY
jgi:alcohol dehydrogenase class IV